jgi:hypothetical protein
MLKRRGILLLYREIGDYWLHRLTGSGLDVVGLHPDGGSDAVDSLDKMLEMVKSPIFLDFAKGLAIAGIDLEFEAHTLSWMIPRSLFDRYPTWFRVNAQGERTPDLNFCASNKDALSWIEDRAAQLATALIPTTGRHYYWSDDVDGDCFCHCPECRQYTASDQYMIYANAVLRGIRRFDPDATHGYLAYYATLEPPRKVDPENGIFLEYAPIRRDQFTPINDPGSEQNKREARPVPDLLACFGREKSQVLEYWIDNSRYSGWRLPYKKLHFDATVMRRDVDFYLHSGFESLTSFGCWLDQSYYDQYGEPPLKEYIKAFDDRAT